MERVEEFEGQSLQNTLAAMADDLLLLARLHDRELDEGLLNDLRSVAPANWFAVTNEAEDFTTGLSLMNNDLAAISNKHEALDALAAEFTDIYLTFAKRVAPNESYWLTDDHIERQEPMFSVRDWYAHYGLKAANWRIRADDHLVSELEFLAALLADGREVALLDAGRFMDRHLLRWSGDFFAGMAQRADVQFYAGLALVSHSHLELCRSILAVATGDPIVKIAPPKKLAAEEAAFIPGAQPSW